METKPDRIDEVARLVESRIRGLFDEARDQINEAINVAVEDAQDDPEGKKEATVSLPIAVKWNLDRNGVNTSLAVTVKRKFEAVDKLEDPNQPTLPGVESVTITTGGGSITPEQASGILRAAAKSGNRARMQVEEGGAS